MRAASHEADRACRCLTVLPCSLSNVRTGPLLPGLGMTQCSLPAHAGMEYLHSRRVVHFDLVSRAIAYACSVTPPCGNLVLSPACLLAQDHAQALPCPTLGGKLRVAD